LFPLAKFYAMKKVCTFDVLKLCRGATLADRKSQKKSGKKLPLFLVKN